MNVTILVLGLGLLVLYGCVLMMNRHIDALETECDTYVHGLLELTKKIEVCEKIQDELGKQTKDFDKRLDKFEFAVQRSDNEVDFTSGVDAILSYNAHDALKEAKKGAGDA